MCKSHPVEICHTFYCVQRIILLVDFKSWSTPGPYNWTRRSVLVQTFFGTSVAHRMPMYSHNSVPPGNNWLNRALAPGVKGRNHVPRTTKLDHSFSTVLLGLRTQVRIDTGTHPAVWNNTSRSERIPSCRRFFPKTTNIPRGIQEVYEPN